MARQTPSPFLRPGWTKWNGMLGYSFKKGRVRADVFPSHDPGPPGPNGVPHFAWRADVWLESRDQPITSLFDAEPWDLAPQVEAFVEQYP